MRRGRALLPHPRARPHGDDWAVSARVIASLLDVSETTVRRKLAPITMDEATSVLLYSEREAAALWAARPEIVVSRATRSRAVS